MTGIQHIAKELEDRSHLFAQLPNDDNQLVWAAAHLITSTFARPKDWDEELWRTLCGLTYDTRLAVAGALMAISLDKMKEAGKKKVNIYGPKNDE